MATTFPAAQSAAASPRMLLPIGDDNRDRRSIPVVVWTIFAANAVGWALQLHGGDVFTAAWAAVPYEISTGTDLVAPTPVGPDRVLIPQAPGPTPIALTLLSSMFLHGSWMHLIGNMLYLLIFADQIEDRLGHLRFALFYLLCGLGAGLAQVLGDTTSVIPCVGASGAIAGCLGAYLISHPLRRVYVLVLVRVFSLPAFLVLGGWVALQIIGQQQAQTGTGGVAYLAHLGGFAVGVILLFVLSLGRKSP